MMGQPRISPIYRHGQPAADQDPLATYARIDHLRRRAWREKQIISISLAELPEPLRGLVKAWAEDTYGY